MYKEKKGTISVGFGEILEGIVQGRVQNTAGSASEDATIRLIGSEDRITSTDPNSHFIYNHVSPGETVLLVSKAGYYNLQIKGCVVPNRAWVFTQSCHASAREHSLVWSTCLTLCTVGLNKKRPQVQRTSILMKYCRIRIRPKYGLRLKLH